MRRAAAWRKKQIMRDFDSRTVDLRVDNALVADVFNGEFFRESVCVKNGKIVGFGRRPAERVVDAEGAYLLPNFIDAHVHIESSMLDPEQFARLVVPMGTGVVIADPHEIANVKGLDGARYILEAAEHTFLEVKLMLPSCVPALDFEMSGAVLTAADLERMIDEENVLGLGEMMNVPGVLSGSEDVLAKIKLAACRGKMIDGHAPGLSGEGLDAYAAAGVATDHECTSIQEVRDRIRRGMYVALREGSAARDLLKLLGAVDQKNLSRCMFCTDDKQCSDIIRRGHINGSVAMAVKQGVEPIDAVRMATIAPAQAYGLKTKGAVAPGMDADFMLVRSFEDCRPHAVFCRGRLAARDGVYNDEGENPPGSRAAALREEMQRSMNMVLPKSIAVRAPSGRVRAMRLKPHSLLTEAVELDVAVDENGVVDMKRNPGLVKIVVVERHKASGSFAVGFIHQDYGLKNGAAALSISHDSHNVVAAGDDDEDIMLALGRLQEIGGGIVMTSAGVVESELALEIGGLMSAKPAGEVAAKLEELYKLADEKHSISKDADAFMSLSFMALPVIPSLKITPKGLFDVDKFEFVPLQAD